MQQRIEAIQRNNLKNKLDDLKKYVKQCYNLNNQLEQQNNSETTNKKFTELNNISTRKWLDKRKPKVLKVGQKDTNQQAIVSLDIADAKEDSLISNMFNTIVINQSTQTLKDQQQQNNQNFKIYVEDLYKLLRFNGFYIQLKVLQDIFNEIVTNVHEKHMITESQFKTMVMSDRVNRIYKKAQQQQKQRSGNSSPTKQYNYRTISNLLSPKNQSFSLAVEEYNTVQPSSFSLLLLHLVYKLNHHSIIEFLEMTDQNINFTIQDKISGFDLLFELFENLNNDRILNQAEKRIIRKMKPEVSEMINKKQQIFNVNYLIKKQDEMNKTDFSDFLQKTPTSALKNLKTQQFLQEIYDSNFNIERISSQRFVQMQSKQENDTNQKKSQQQIKFKKIQSQTSIRQNHQEVDSSQEISSQESYDNNHIDQFLNVEENNTILQEEVSELCERASKKGKEQAQNELKSQLASKTIGAIDQSISFRENYYANLTQQFQNNDSLLKRSQNLKQCRGGSLQITKFPSMDVTDANFKVLPRYNNSIDANSSISKFKQLNMQQLKKQRMENLNNNMMHHLDEVQLDSKQKLIQEFIGLTQSKNINNNSSNNQNEGLKGNLSIEKYQDIAKLFEIKKRDYLQEVQLQVSGNRNKEKDDRTNKNKNQISSENSLMSDQIKNLQLENSDNENSFTKQNISQNQLVKRDIKLPSINTNYRLQQQSVSPTAHLSSFKKYQNGNDAREEQSQSSSSSSPKNALIQSQNQKSKQTNLPFLKKTTLQHM